MQPITLLNVDLDIESKRPLQPIIDALGGNVTVLHDTSRDECYRASFELTTHEDDAERLINRYIELIEQLPAEARACWDQCTTRTFDIGYDSGYAPGELHSGLSEAALAGLVRVGGRLVVTIYPVPENT